MTVETPSNLLIRIDKNGRKIFIKHKLPYSIDLDNYTVTDGKLYCGSHKTRFEAERDLWFRDKNGANIKCEIYNPGDKIPWKNEVKMKDETTI